MPRLDRVSALCVAAVLGWTVSACTQPETANVQQASGWEATAASDLLGGAKGRVKMNVRGIMDQPVDGLMVQLISHNTSIRTTVYTSELGEFEFPELPSGDYVLRIPRPLHFHQYQQDSVHIDGATLLPDIYVERRSDNEFLPPSKDLLDQLTGAEWLFNVEGSHQVKRTLVNSCSTGCHGSERAFSRRFDERSWRLILHRMSNYSQRILVNSSGRDHTQLTEDGEMLAEWLARVRGLDSEVPPIVPFDRPKGLATRAIITEYELPWALVNIHDVSGDTEGNIWFNINRSPFIGKLDPNTGEVTQYRLPEPRYPAYDDPQDRFYQAFLSRDPSEPLQQSRDPDGPLGVHPGTHWLEFDENTGRVWFTQAWARNVGVLDPRTGEIRHVFTGGQGNHTLSPDGLSIWRTHQGKILRWDTRTMMDSEGGIARPADEYELEYVDNTYGNFVSPDGNFFGGSSGGWVVWLDIRSGEVREIPVEVPGSRGRGSFGPDGSVWGGMRKLTRYNPTTNAVTQYDPPTPYFHAYSTKVDKNGEVWSGQQSSGRVYRFNPDTNRWIEYVLPSIWSHDFNSWIDNSTDPPTFWYGDQHGYIVRIQPLE